MTWMLVIPFEGLNVGEVSWVNGDNYKFEFLTIKVSMFQVLNTYVRICKFFVSNQLLISN